MLVALTSARSVSAPIVGLRMGGGAVRSHPESAAGPVVPGLAVGSAAGRLTLVRSALAGPVVGAGWLLLLALQLPRLPPGLPDPPAEGLAELRERLGAAPDEGEDDEEDEDEGEVAHAGIVADRRDVGAGPPLPDPRLAGGAAVRTAPSRYREPTMATEPLLVFGPWSIRYDFGPSHPLTPRRFGPGIDLLRSLGAEPGLAPEPVSDEALLACHTAAYVRTVRHFSVDPGAPPAAGIGPGDNPPFPGMHEAAAAVAGGSLAAVEAILRGEVEHAFHPGGGLHHTLADRASGFCIYNDPALAIARARAAGLRVLYVDLDVHHGDGVQALHLADPGVLTFSIHESGRYLFPGTGFVDELGPGPAAGTAVNVPLEPYTGEGAWLAAVERLVPELAAVFGPDFIVSQHGADSHALDPLAHLRVTTTAMGAAARLVDAVAHRHARGRWLATGGGGYDVYRVVPRAWALTWLAAAHRPVPAAIDPGWRERWAREAVRYDQAPLPTSFEDPPNAGFPLRPEQEAADEGAEGVVTLVRTLVVPALVREAVDRGWWAPLPGWTPRADAPGSVVDGLVGLTSASRAEPGGADDPSLEPTLVPLDRALLDRVRLADRVAPLQDLGELRAILAAALAAGARGIAAVAGETVVGLALAARVEPAGGVSSTGSGPSSHREAGPQAPGSGAAGTVERLLVVGVAPSRRRRGLGRALLRRLVEEAPGDSSLLALVTAAERDVVDPADRRERRTAALRLLEGAGFQLEGVLPSVAAADPDAVAARRRSGG